jgi:NitT/TauT family transport system substrate-binding protein
MEVGKYLNVSSDMFVVREPVYQQKKALLKRFLKAYRDSAAWMIAKPEEAAQLATKRAIDGRAPAVNLEIIRARNASSVSPATEKGGLGAFDMASLQKAADAYKKLGLIKHDIKVGDVVSQDLLPGKELGT